MSRGRSGRESWSRITPYRIRTKAGGYTYVAEQAIPDGSVRQALLAVRGD